MKVFQESDTLCLNSALIRPMIRLSIADRISCHKISSQTGGNSQTVEAEEKGRERSFTFMALLQYGKGK